MSQKSSKWMTSTVNMVRLLKNKNYLPKNCDDFIKLPADPDKRIILVSVHSKYLVTLSKKIDLLVNNEGTMNYSQMVEAVREGKHCRRPTWSPEERIWSDGKILIHNKPYFQEPFNQGIQGYVYVCEQIDVVADDWMVANA